jgi:hypothetical protein
MATFRRLLLITLVAIFAFGPIAVAVAQSNESDPNRPVSHPTPTDTDTPETSSSSSNQNDIAWPFGDETVDLAAVVLPLDELPNVFSDYGEFHLDADMYSQFGGGLPSKDAILATGFQNSYVSSFRSSKGETIVIRIVLFADPGQVKGGFALLQDDEAVTPNGEMIDAPALEDIGGSPGEVTTGYSQEVQGDLNHIYSATFTVGPMLITVEMQSYDEDSLDPDLVRDISDAQADRAQSALDGDELSGIDEQLPPYLLWSAAPLLAYDGFTITSADYLLSTMTTIPDGLVSAYSYSYPLDARADSPYPYLSMVLASFDDESALTDAFDDPDSLMSDFPEQEQIDDPGVSGADNVLLFTYSLPNIGPGARIYIQSGEVLAIIDAQGAASVDDATAFASAFGQAQIDCINGDGCAIPEGLPTPNIFETDQEE